MIAYVLGLIWAENLSDTTHSSIARRLGILAQLQV
jgi:hypothetical protein